jgi:hypothetical protein
MVSCNPGKNLGQVTRFGIAGVWERWRSLSACGKRLLGRSPAVLHASRVVTARIFQEESKELISVLQVVSEDAARAGRAWIE